MTKRHNTNHNHPAHTPPQGTPHPPPTKARELDMSSPCARYWPYRRTRPVRPIDEQGVHDNRLITNKLPNAVFCDAKHGISHVKKRPFAMRKDACYGSSAVLTVAERLELALSGRLTAIL